MRNKDLIESFVRNRHFNGRTGSMTATDGKLFSYNTCIAQHTKDGRLVINNTRYSVTTSKQQGYLRTAAKNFHDKVECVENIDFNTQRLVKE